MKMAQPKLMAEMHPGRTIVEDVLKPLRMSVNALAKELRVPTTRLNDIVRRRRGITADTALRLARYLGTSPRFWLNLQTIFDLRVAEYEKRRIIHKQISPRKVS
jgi:antitoxin HigA-1